MPDVNSLNPFSNWDSNSFVPPERQITNLVYPHNLLSAGKRPMIQFYCNSTRIQLNERYPTNIFFPIPDGIEIADGSNYDDADLGVLGAAALNVVKSNQSGTSLSSALTNEIGKANDSLNNSSISQLLAALSTSPVGSDLSVVRSGMSIGMKAMYNKHITTEFTGVSTRAHAFKFKMIATSKAESDTVRNIISSFRLGLYPEGNAILLNYPPTWTIRFLHPDGTDIKYIPKIFECYLQGVTASYNSSGNMWHDDGAPLECDVAISFKETRSLVAQDIARLEEAAFDTLSFPNKINIPNEIQSDTPTSNTSTVA